MVKRKWIKYIIRGLIIVIGGLWWFNRPVDIRNKYLRHSLTADDYEKGKALIREMETAYGGKEAWLRQLMVSFVQRAEWYGRQKISHWDTLPKRFELRAKPGSDNCEMTLLNGPNTGTIWGVENGQTYTFDQDRNRKNTEPNAYTDKLIYKNYWFQFPFRIGEAPIIAYAGSEELEGKNYDLIYATWGSEKANPEYDQFVLYLNKESRLVEYLHFTVREKFGAIGLTAKFEDFRRIGPFRLPQSQFVRLGNPLKKGLKMHENHYELIQLDTIPVLNEK